MEKLLFISAFPPNNRSGGQKYSCNAIHDLSKEYRIDLVYFKYKDHVIEQYLPVGLITAFEVRKFDWLLNAGMYPLFSRRFNRCVLTYLKHRATQYDVLFFNYSQAAVYALYIEHPYKIIRCHDIVYQSVVRKNKILAPWVKFCERKILNTADKIFVPSEKDAELLGKIYGIDAFFTNEYMSEFKLYETVIQQNQFVFYGVWSRKENLEGLLWFIKNVMPLIKNNLNIQFVIIGGGLDDKLLKKYMYQYVNFKYLGFVDDPLDIIYNSSAVIAPLFHGAGVKIKVIDAFTVGTPVMGTEITFEGLPYIDGLRYKLTTPQEYARGLSTFSSTSSEKKQDFAGQFRYTYDNKHLLEQL
jgi:glycosyltransferase involved in cell wall biosynthesis